MEVATTIVRAGRHEIEASLFGGGFPVVVIEPGYGGHAGQWRHIAEAVAQQTTVLTYDRVPYGASSAARDGRAPRDVARDLRGVLRGLDVEGPLVLVGHSIGGIYMRTFAALHPDEVAGMVFVDSSYEGQRQLTRGHVPWKWQLMDVFTVPSIIFSSPDARNGGDRRSLIREFRTFTRLTEADQALLPGDLGGKPVIVLTRARDAAMDDRGFWPVWHGLHANLARLSSNSRHIISSSPNHYLNKGDPGLIIDSIQRVVNSARTSDPLEAPATLDESR